MMEDRIAARVLRYLERQRGWLEMRIAEVETLQAQVGDESLEEQLVALQPVRAEELATFQREQQALFSEWEKAEDVDDDEREAVRALAAQCEQQIEVLTGLQSASLPELLRRQAESTAGLGQIRRGRDMMRRYGSGEDEPSEGVDRRA